MRFEQVTHPDRVVHVGVVGLGMGASHVNWLLKTPGMEVAALCDLDAERIAKAQQAIAGAGRAPAAEFGSYDDLLASEGCEALVLALPIPRNAEFARRGLEAGRHVLSEKPLATTLADAARLRRAVRPDGPVYQIGFEMRHSPLVQTVLEAIQQGKIGRPAAVNYTYVRRSKHSGRSWANEGPECGILFDCGSHIFDLCGLFAGAPMEQAFAFCSKESDLIPDNPDVGAVAVRFANGVHGTVMFCEFCAQPDWTHMMIVGDDGKILINPSDAGEFTLYWGKGQHCTHTRINPASTNPGHLGMGEQHVEFKNAITEARQPYADLQVGLESLYLSVGALRSWQEGLAVSREELAREVQAEAR